MKHKTGDTNDRTTWNLYQNRKWKRVLRKGWQYYIYKLQILFKEGLWWFLPYPSSQGL